MEFGICHLNFIAIRNEPSDRSEMVSQILFGETFQVLISEGDWIKIHLDYDFYEGWVLKKQVSELTETSYNRISANNNTCSDEMVTFIQDKHDQLQILTLGASLPEFKNGQFSIADNTYEFDGDVISEKMPKLNLVRTAYKFVNTPYLW